MTEEQANTYFDELNKIGELSDDELDNAAGGCSSEPPNAVDKHHSCDNWRCKKCGIDSEAAGIQHRHGATLYGPCCILLP